MATTTPSYNFNLPTVGGDTNTWGGLLNDNWSLVDDLFDGTAQVVGMNLDAGLLRIPRWNTAGRPSSPATGQIGWNTELSLFEGYDGSAWGNLGGAGLFKGENGSSGDTNLGAGDIFRVHEQTLNTDVTIDADENAVAVGPLEVASGVTLTVSAGGGLAIV